MTVKKVKKPVGGARTGAGRKPGIPNRSTVEASIEKEALRERVRVRVAKELDPILDAQIANAKGISHFFLRDPKTGQFVRVTDEKAIQTALNSGDQDTHYWIFTKDPSAQSSKDLLDRAMDKAIEAVQVTGADGKPLIIQWAS